MDNVVKQLKQFKTDVIYEKKSIIMQQKESVNIINGYQLFKLF